MKKIFLGISILFYGISFGQDSFREIVSTISYEETVNQTKSFALIYNGTFSNYDELKTKIYSYVDSKISDFDAEFNLDQDLTTRWEFLIYKSTDVLNDSYVYDFELIENDIPYIRNHNKDVIAFVTYKKVNQRKHIDFYSNNQLVKIYNGNNEKSITEFNMKLIGDLDVLLNNN